jgi:hypothetical protein
MKIRHTILTLLVCAPASFSIIVAQTPVPTVNPQRHGNLAAAQAFIVQAYSQIGSAQHDNDSHLGGHAQKAKDLLSQANDEIRAAADVADQNQANAPEALLTPPASSTLPITGQVPTSPPNISGNWTIYAYNISQPGSSLKEVQLNQSGNIISGSFHGPHQRGKLQGWINGSHVEFSTDTRDVLTFRGEITLTGMSGLYGAHGQHAPWNAERTN